MLLCVAVDSMLRHFSKISTLFRLFRVANFILLADSPFIRASGSQIKKNEIGEIIDINKNV